MPAFHNATSRAAVGAAAPRAVTRRNIPLLVRYDPADSRVIYHVPDGAFSLTVPHKGVARILVAALRAYLHARIDKRTVAAKARATVTRKRKLLRQLDRTIRAEQAKRIT